VRHPGLLTPELVEPYAQAPATKSGGAVGTPPTWPREHGSCRYRASELSVSELPDSREQRHRQVVVAVLAAAPELSSSQVQAAMMVVAGHPAALRSLAAALIADPGALTVGAPPVVGALVTELAARGAPSLPEPACALRRRPGLPLTRSVAGGICARCGRLRRIARRADGGQPDICDGCFRLPTADCARCGRARPCSFASGSDRSASAARHNGSAHASAATSSRPLRRTGPKGRVCDPCYAAALRHRGTCDSCRATRRLVVPAGPDATTCADCAGLDPHPRVHRLRDRGQALRARPVRTVRVGPPHQ